jgi:catechol 2,3-dioxygenase-like lactoylglutathione lyase family enzyme
MKSAHLLFVIVMFCLLSPSLQAVQAAENAAKYMGLAHIQIQTKDIEKSIRFYQDNLHFAVVDRSELSVPSGTIKTALIKQGSCVLELSQPPNPDSVVEKARGVMGHFALQVDNVEKAVAELKARGITPDRDVSSNNLFGGIRIAFISGPSGESIELFEYTNPNSKAAQAK